MRKMIFSYYLYIFLCSFGNSIVGANAVVYVKEYLVLSSWQQSLLLSLGPIIIGLLDYPLGNVADYWGMKRTMVSGFLMVGLASLVYSLTRDFPILLMSLFFIALGTALISGTGQSWLHHALGEGEKDLFQKTLSRGVLISRSTNLGAALMAPSLISLAQNMPFMVHGLCFLLGGLVLVFTIRKDFRLNMKETKNPSFYYFLKKNTKEIFSSPLLRQLMLMTVCEMSFLAVFLFSWQVLIVKEYSTRQEMLGVVYIFLRVVLLGIGILFHKVRRSLTTKAVMRIYVGLVGMGIILSCFSGGILVTGLVVLEMAIGLISHQNSIFMNQIVSHEARTSVFSAVSTIASLSMAIIFFVMSYFSTEMVFKGFIIVSLGAAVGMVGIYKKIYQ